MNKIGHKVVMTNIHLQCNNISFCVYFCRRLEARLKTMDGETEIMMKDWREKCDILKSGIDAAEEKIQQGKKAKSPEEKESCYIKLKVCIGLMPIPKARD